MARTKDVAKLKAQMKKLEEELDRAFEQQGKKLASIASDAGLFELDLSDAQWKEGFDAMAERFRNDASQSSSSAPKEPRSFGENAGAHSTFGA